MLEVRFVARVAGWVWRYGRQMLLPALAALGVLWLCRPWRQRRLAARGLTAPAAHETALVIFTAFCAGLAALTLFPAGFWELSRLRYGGIFDGYLPWSDVLGRLNSLKDMTTPFQAIRRAVRVNHSWLWFMLAGNIAMFVPLGFFPALLWRGWTWWKSLLAGFCTSFVIEFVQFFIGRSTDIDDVILNTTGAVLGYVIYRLLAAAAPAVGTACKCREVEKHG